MRYYSTLRVEVVVHMPATIHGRRPNGSEYTREAWLPVGDLGLGRQYNKEDLTTSQRADAIKIEVLRALPSLESGAIQESSGEA